MSNILETERLVLREMTQADYPALAAIMRDERTMYAYEGPFSVTETMEWLDRQLKRYQQDGFGLWAVDLKASGDMIGQTGISWQDLDGKRIPEIGYLFNRAFWGNGYATEAAIGCKAYAFDTLGMHEVYSIIRDTNLASINVAIRNGMLARSRIVKHFRGVDMPHLAFSVRRTAKGTV
jgi:RimJ/RimL family protein N-acetyltransferase